MNVNFQTEVEDLLRRILKHDDPVSIRLLLSKASPDARVEVCRQFRENTMLRQSFETATLIFDELIGKELNA